VISSNPKLHHIGTCSTVGGWCFEVDAAWYQDESSAALFPSLNPNLTKPDAIWVGVVTPAGQTLDLNE